MKSPYTSYPAGYARLLKDLKMPFYMRLMAKKFMPLLLTILIDG